MTIEAEEDFDGNEKPRYTYLIIEIKSSILCTYTWCSARFK